MVDERRTFGNRGEEIAVAYLRGQGYEIVAQQWKRLPMGEIDIVARQGKELVFIEVKTRSTDEFGAAEEAVTRVKRQKIEKLIEWFISAHRFRGPYRFDVIAIDFSDREPKINHLQSVGV